MRTLQKELPKTGSSLKNIYLTFKLLRYIGEEVTDGKVLGAGLLAFAAFDAVRGFSARFGVNYIIIVICVPVMIQLLGIHHCEKVRDGNTLRTAVRTVAAGRAGDQILASENFLYLLYGGKLFFI